MKKKLSLAFLIPVLVVLFSFLILKVYPFGDSTIVAIDSNTQYVSFISYLKTIFLGLNDLKYTFSASLGENFIPLLGYYLMSPFNLLTLLFKNSNIKLIFTIIILIKIGLCGLTMEYYLQKKHKNKNTLLFSICYALMSYNIIYMYHTMWFDSVLLFPLVILGIDYIFEDKKPILYIISLSLSIIFNYYIGVIVCLGSVIYFVYKYILEYKIIEKFKVFVNYAASSLLSGMISAFIILPSVFGLQSSKATFGLDNLNFGITTSYLKIIAKLFTGSAGAGEVWRGGPMIACGMLIFILVILYFVNKNISKKEKIVTGGLLIFLTSSFAINALDLIFHGLNTPNCFDFRHAFIFVFFMIMIACKCFVNFDKKDTNFFKYLGIGFIGLSLLIYLQKYKFNSSTYGLTILFSLVVVFILLYLLSRKKISYKTLFIITIIDLLFNTSSYIVILKSADNQSISNYSNYVELVSDTTDKIKELDNGFYRVEKTFDREKNKNMLAINDSMIFDYNGISHFDSTTRTDVELFLEQLGHRRLVSRAYYNKYGSTTLSDMLLGIKYVMSYDNYKNYYKVINDDISVYKNPYYLSIGYAIDNDYTINSNNPFVNQNNIIKSFTSFNEDIYKEASYKLEVKNATLNDNVYTPNGLGELKYLININSNDNLYFYFPTSGEVQEKFQDAKMYVNGEYIEDYFSKYNWGVISLGKFAIGDVIELKFEFDKDLVIYDSYFYFENLDILQKHYNIISSNQVNLEKISSSNLKGTINLNEDKTILFTIPYDDGWEIKVDGKVYKTKTALGVMTSIDLEKGYHEIELNYTPKFLKLGFIVSIIGVIGSLIYLLLIDKIWALYFKFKEIFNYLIIGVMTTIVSLLSYFILSRILDIENNLYFIIANTLSWILSVLFAYITNKTFVFNSKTKGNETIKEAMKFVSSRLVTYGIDLLIMFIFVKVIKLNNDASKLLVQFIVLVLNYVFSKLLVFKK